MLTTIAVVNGVTVVASSFLDTCRVSETIQLWAQVVLGRFSVNLHRGWVIYNFWGRTSRFRCHKCLVVWNGRLWFMLLFLPWDLLAQVLNPVKHWLHAPIRHFQAIRGALESIRHWISLGVASYRLPVFSAKRRVYGGREVWFAVVFTSNV